jgi:hypothetical protein
MKPAATVVFALYLAAGLLHTQSAAAEGQGELAAQPTTRKASTTFVMHGYKGLNPDASFGSLKAEFEKRGFPCIIVVTPHTQTKTPNQDRARDVVDALRDVKGDVALLGVSNQGLFLPLVAAAQMDTDGHG